MKQTSSITVPNKASTEEAILSARETAIKARAAYDEARRESEAAFEKVKAVDERGEATVEMAREALTTIAAELTKMRLLTDAEKRLSDTLSAAYEVTHIKQN